MENKAPIVIVAGIGKTNHAIGKNNDLLWHVPADLRRFKELTTDKPIIMGRKTFESILNILGKPLPNRTNIVITRDLSYSHEGAKIAHSLEEALKLAELENPKEIHIGGGSNLYEQALPLVSKLYITWFFEEKDGDTFFPEFENDFTVVKTQQMMEHEGIKFQWVDYERKRS